VKIVLAAISVSREEITDLFKTGAPQYYIKVGTVEARRAKKGEEIETKVKGETETTNKAGADDVVVKGASNELYIMAREKFLSRYDGPDLTEDFEEYSATGSCYATEWTGEKTQFEAAWGEAMVINPGDYLCSPNLDGLGDDNEFDVYRIEKDTFSNTYQKEEP
jgi:hypothetical protein